ncbi:MAG: CBS domain-containing protein [Alphaproteobacteria bacterium]|nr:CBS domain-containing protein [Alphaproteobacteria bacterium]
MKIQQIIQTKGGDVIALRPEDTVQTAATVLATNKIGALPVKDANDSLIGILSERDIVKGVHKYGHKALDLLVHNLMTKEVTTCNMEDDVREVQQIMHSGHFRHIPVTQDGKLLGVISQGDVVHMCLIQAENEASVMRDIAIARS